ncbi:hypothetical protein Goshw_004990 [Gossypium schwendimanii]|uniref:Uncharacterized protein n=1 Tax=Gossypium schwendimanii TaxID=34291 RepID=A0A7J9M138_GOSSC|nr:hypothetical protein [Gossypium schwendimanii]
MCSYNWGYWWMGLYLSSPRDDSTKVERIRYTQAYIFEILGGI